MSAFLCDLDGHYIVFGYRWHKSTHQHPPFNRFCGNEKQTRSRRQRKARFAKLMDLLCNYVITIANDQLWKHAFYAKHLPKGSTAGRPRTVLGIPCTCDAATTLRTGGLFNCLPPLGLHSVYRSVNPGVPPVQCTRNWRFCCFLMDLITDALIINIHFRPDGRPDPVIGSSVSRPTLSSLSPIRPASRTFLFLSLALWFWKTITG